MTDEPETNGSYRITTGVLYTQLQALQSQVATLSQQLTLVDERLNNDRESAKADRGRISKVEQRLNGVFVGLGTGLFVGVVAFLRGVLP